jgi:hypothetical protein
MTPDDVFLKAIIQNPDDDTPRLVVLPHWEMLPRGAPNAAAVHQPPSSAFRLPEAACSVWACDQAHQGRARPA